MGRPFKDKYRYTVPWLGITGGVMAFTQPQYEAVNGFSNEYWGWGCEDDDMFVRIVDSCLHLEQGESLLVCSGLKDLWIRVGWSSLTDQDKAFGRS